MKNKVKKNNDVISPVIWFSGLAASGKSTLAKAVAEKFEELGIRYELIDGDEVRNFFEGDLGYSRKEREDNIRRIAFAAYLLSKQGIIVLVANIAPYQKIRNWIRKKINSLILIYMNASVEECIGRDYKGVYLQKKTPVCGVDELYEIPLDADLKIDSTKENITVSCEKVLNYLRKKKIL